MEYQESYERIIFEKKNHIGYVTINYPEKLNSLNLSVFRDLNNVFDAMKADKDVWGVILTGTGRAFCAGADQTGMPTIEGNYIEGFRNQLTENSHYTFKKIAEFPYPVLAAINGYALGGGAELACACDLRIISNVAKVGFPEPNLGGMACYGGPTRLPRLIGMAAAKEMFFTARHFTADEVLRFGFVSKISEPDNLISDAEDIMNNIVSKSPMSIRYLKLMLNRGIEMSTEASLEMEKNMAPITHTCEDRKEGQAAFREKRKPEFKNC